MRDLGPIDGVRTDPDGALGRLVDEGVLATRELPPVLGEDLDAQGDGAAEIHGVAAAHELPGRNVDRVGREAHGLLGTRRREEHEPSDREERPLHAAASDASRRRRRA